MVQENRNRKTAASLKDFDQASFDSRMNDIFRENPLGYGFASTAGDGAGSLYSPGAAVAAAAAAASAPAAAAAPAPAAAQDLYAADQPLGQLPHQQPQALTDFQMQKQPGRQVFESGQIMDQQAGHSHGHYGCASGRHAMVSPQSVQPVQADPGAQPWAPDNSLQPGMQGAQTHSGVPGMATAAAAAAAAAAGAASAGSGANPWGSAVPAVMPGQGCLISDESEGMDRAALAAQAEQVAVMAAAADAAGAYRVSRNHNREAMRLSMPSSQPPRSMSMDEFLNQSQHHNSWINTIPERHSAGSGANAGAADAATAASSAARRAGGAGAVAPGHAGALSAPEPAMTVSDSDSDYPAMAGLPLPDLQDRQIAGLSMTDGQINYYAPGQSAARMQPGPSGHAAQSAMTEHGAATAAAAAAAAACTHYGAAAGNYGNEAGAAMFKSMAGEPDTQAAQVQAAQALAARLAAAQNGMSAQVPAVDPAQGQFAVPGRAAAQPAGASTAVPPSSAPSYAQLHGSGQYQDQAGLEYHTQTGLEYQAQPQTQSQEHVHSAVPGRAAAHTSLPSPAQAAPSSSFPSYAHLQGSGQYLEPAQGPSAFPEAGAHVVGGQSDGQSEGQDQGGALYLDGYASTVTARTFGIAAQSIAAGAGAGADAFDAGAGAAEQVYYEALPDTAMVPGIRDQGHNGADTSSFNHPDMAAGMGGAAGAAATAGPAGAARAAQGAYEAYAGACGNDGVCADASVDVDSGAYAGPDVGTVQPWNFVPDRACLDEGAKALNAVGELSSQTMNFGAASDDRGAAVMQTATQLCDSFNAAEQANASELANVAVSHCQDQWDTGAAAAADDAGGGAGGYGAGAEPDASADAAAAAAVEAEAAGLPWLRARRGTGWAQSAMGWFDEADAHVEALDDPFARAPGSAADGAGNPDLDGGYDHGDQDGAGSMAEAMAPATAQAPAMAAAEAGAGRSRGYIRDAVRQALESMSDMSTGDKQVDGVNITRGMEAAGNDVLKQRTFRSIEIIKDLGMITDDTVYSAYCQLMHKSGLDPLTRFQLISINVMAFFKEGGLLSSYIDNYNPRQGQIDFATAVTSMQSRNGFLVVEAGTGTGKTFSYLVPPILGGLKVMVSTRTKALQDQLISKDIPALFDMLGKDHLHAISLKGQSNYICRYLLDGHGRNYINSRDYERISSYVDECTDSMDRSPRNAKFGEINFAVKDRDRPFMACDYRQCREMSATCPYASNRREFLNQLSEAAHYEHSAYGNSSDDEESKISLKNIDIKSLPDIDGSHCFSFAARQEARKRDVAVINHSLFFAALQNPAGFGELGSSLPLPDVLVFDEAHTLAEVGREFFSRSISHEGIINLVEKAHKAFENTSTTIGSSDLGTALTRLAYLSNIINNALMLMPEGRNSVTRIKYHHRLYPSPFQLLGADLCAPLTLSVLPEDSAFVKMVKEARARGSAAGEGIDAQSEELIDDSLNMDKLGTGTEKQFAVKLGVLYEKRRADWNRMTGLHTSSKDSMDYENAVDELKDVIFDARGRPEIDPYFRALMIDMLILTRECRSKFDKFKEVNESEIEPLIEQCEEMEQFIADFMTTDRDKSGAVTWDNAGWVECEGDRRSLVVCPVEIGSYLGAALRKLRDLGTTVIFTSATITVEKTFNKFCYDIGLGLDEVACKIVQSPFDYASNSCILRSADFPAINARNRISDGLEMIDRLIKASPGGVFILTTSNYAIKEAWEWVNSRYGRSRKVLKQGDGNIGTLMKQFREDGHAILIGTSSFWEGVDVPGNALTLVIIDKLPFKQVADPVLQARRYRMELRTGGNFFSDVQVPETIITLRQGAGRLIRNESDTGVLVLLDPRAAKSGYANRVINSLPEMTRVSTVDEALRFFN